MQAKPKKILNDVAIKAAKPKAKIYRLADGTVGGLFLSVSPKGKKVFRLKFSYAKKEQLYTIGEYPSYTLSDARQEALRLKALIAKNINPCACKREEKVITEANATTFGEITNEWFDMSSTAWSKVHIENINQKLAAYILPHLAKKPILEVSRIDIENVLNILAGQKKAPTLKKVRSIISRILRHAMMRDFPVTDWTTLYKGMCKAAPVKHRACLTEPKDVARLMRSISGYAEVSLQTSLAMQFSAYTFARPIEVRHAEWAELDFEEKLWRIPADKMKMKQPHLVPLTPQLLKLLEELRPLTCQSKFLFPTIRSHDKPMSEATVLVALRAMGFTKDEMTAHGFRGMASTLLNEQGYNADWIERQLAHGERDEIRGAYNHAQYLPQRRQMMQEWCAYLDKLELSG